MKTISLPLLTSGTRAVVYLLMGWGLSQGALASAPTEKVVCTQAPRHTWLSEPQARAAFNDSAYALVRFKVSRGNCHEFYAIEPSGAVVETYQHPVTGKAVRTTRIAPPSPVQTQHAQR